MVKVYVEKGRLIQILELHKEPSQSTIEVDIPDPLVESYIKFMHAFLKLSDQVKNYI